VRSRTTRFTPHDLDSPKEWLEKNNLFRFFDRCLILKEFWQIDTEWYRATANLIAFLFKANVLNYDEKSLRYIYKYSTLCSRQGKLKNIILNSHKFSHLFIDCMDKSLWEEDLSIEDVCNLNICAKCNKKIQCSLRRLD